MPDDPVSSTGYIVPGGEIKKLLLIVALAPASLAVLPQSASAHGFLATANVNATQRTCKNTNCNSAGTFVGSTSAHSDNYTSGGSYSACGGTSSRWTTLYKSTTVYVANRCVTVAVHP
jgi:hypothetical protein